MSASTLMTEHEQTSKMWIFSTTMMWLIAWKAF